MASIGFTAKFTKYAVHFHRHLLQTMTSTTQLSSCYHGLSGRSVLNPSRICQELPVLGVNIRRWKGHNKWSNIRHIKMAKDMEKSALATLAVNRIRVAAMEGGDTNPKYNPKLAQAVHEAQQNDIPNSTIKAALDRLEKSSKAGQQHYVEGRGFNQSSLIVSLYTDKIKWARSHVQSVLKKFSGAIGNSGTSQHNFEFKGVIRASSADDGTSLDADAAMELAIEAGAEDVQDSVDKNGNDELRFICDPKDLHAVSKSLESKPELITVKSFKHEYLPTNLVRLGEQDLVTAGAMLDKLEDLEFVIEVFHNIASMDEQE